MVIEFIRISSKLNVREHLIAETMRVKNVKIINRFIEVSLFVLKELCPVRTGELRESIKVLQSIRRQSGGEFQGFVKIGPTAHHARFILKGTRNMKANNFVRRSKPIIVEEANLIIEEQYGPGKFNLTRFFRN